MKIADEMVDFGWGWPKDAHASASARPNKRKEAVANIVMQHQ